MHELKNARWRTSSHSAGGNACVEAADLPDGHRAVRDSKDRSGPALTFPAAAWAAITAGVRAGAFH
jgi:hypothetical protein